MNIKRDWKIDLDKNQYLAMQEKTISKLLQKSERGRVFEEALLDIEQAIDPAACWQSFPLKKIVHNKLVLADGTRIGGGPVVTVMKGATEVIAMVCTVGAAVDHLISQAQNQRELFKAMILHDLGAWAVDMVRQELCHQLEEELQQKGWRASTPLSPGESDWSVKEQSVIFSLLDTHQINVSLSPSMIMRPIKSLSLIMGTGVEPIGVEGASNCDFCSIKDRCTYRHKRVASSI
jgi:hypothetical protein